MLENRVLAPRACSIACLRAAPRALRLRACARRARAHTCAAPARDAARNDMRLDNK